MSFNLARRDLESKYKGSWISIAWLVLTPLGMLMVYVFIFSQVFKIKWPTSAQSDLTSPYAVGMLLLIGVTVFQYFSEVCIRATTCVTANPNLVTKVVFPLEALAVSASLSPLVAASIVLLITCITTFILGFGNFFAVPLVVLALTMLWILSTGLALLLAALGVFFRDIGQVVSVLVGALMFLSPIFFPSSAFPEQFKWVLDWNPLSFYIEAL
jgi:lipopolysaccharide transport system permease protein